MGTRAATFTAKIRNLQDYHMRLSHGIVPPPSGIDIANTLKHFSQTLLGVLKDVPNFPLEMLRYRAQDSVRMSLFPSLDYKALFNAVVQLLDLAPSVQVGVEPFGQGVFHTLSCLLPFLEHELIDTLPYLVAASMASLPNSLHQEIMNMLCYRLFPFTLNPGAEGDGDNNASQSISAVLMMIFQYTEAVDYHCQLVECLMSLKEDLSQDLFCVIAYGTPVAQAAAANLLVYYWPHVDHHLYDRRGIQFKYSGWKPINCQWDQCSNSNNIEAVKMCLDHTLSVACANDPPPPLYVCHECSTKIIHGYNMSKNIYDILQPMKIVGMACENKNCKSTEKAAVVVCFSLDCASYNGNRPIRYCAACHALRHNSTRGMDHVWHSCLTSPWEEDAETQGCIVEAIVSLLKASDYFVMVTKDTGKDCSGEPQLRYRLFGEGAEAPAAALIPAEDRRLLGRYGIWLLLGLCTPNERTPSETLGRLLAVLFQWFNVTAYQGTDPAANVVEKMKTEFVCPWLFEIRKRHFEVFVSCLLPHPPEYTRVGGHWDNLSTRTAHLKEGFNNLFCLVPYEIISFDVWTHVMPHWMEAIANEVPDEEMPELKILLSKVMDSDMNSLGFDAKQMYHFATARFQQTSYKVQEQALHWLQVLTSLQIVVPLDLLFTMFSSGIRPLKKPSVPKDPFGKRGSIQEEEDTISAICQDESGTSTPLSDEASAAAPQPERESDDELMLICYIIMIDIILKQLEIQETEQQTVGLNSPFAQQVMVLLKDMVFASGAWAGSSGVNTSHTCNKDGKECAVCEAQVLWFQLVLELIYTLTPPMPVLTHDIPPSASFQFSDASQGDESEGKLLSPESEKKEAKSAEASVSSPKMEMHALGGMLVSMPQLFSHTQIMTATVETVSELDLAPIIPTEKVVKAVARAVTITESDVAQATAQVASATIVGENDEPVPAEGSDEEGNFWLTSVGKFKFTIEELPAQLQYSYELLKKLPDIEDTELLYHLLKCLKVLFLHGEVMSKAAKDHRGFVIWCQENLLIKNLWTLLDAEFSHICAVCVPILVHCITLPTGADVFWKVVEEEYHSTNWKTRFTAVERVTMVCRFLEMPQVKSSSPLQSSLANAFCYLISALDDMSVYVAQRASLYLGTIHDLAMQCLMLCLESQFASVIIDRPVILQSLYSLHNCLSDRHVLTWEFFLNCFDILFLEAQINIEKTGNLGYMRDLKNSDMNSEIFQKKVSRAHDALNLSQSDSGSTVKTLYASFGTKWPYKRTMSAPAAMVARQEKQDKEKVYNRQSSAPVLKRKGSRFGIDGHIQGVAPPAPPPPPPTGPGDDSHVVTFFHRIIEQQETDKDTMHLLIFLLMQFLSHSEQAFPTEDKSLAKHQNIVLRHLNLLLGYSQQEKMFFISPQKLRSTPVFHSFMSNLQQVLDQNFQMGTAILPSCLALLNYCPAPHRISADFHDEPNYGLWFLEPHTRRCWLMALIVVLYKYQYQSPILVLEIAPLLRIVLNTLTAQHHQCHVKPGAVVIDEATYKSKDLSQLDLESIGEHNTHITQPPPSPYWVPNQTQEGTVTLIGGTGEGVKYRRGRTSEGADIMTSKMQEGSFEFMSSTETDDLEPELEAIPESSKSEESPQESLQECLMPIKETAAIAEDEGGLHYACTVTPTIEGVVSPDVVVVESSQVVESHMVEQIEAFGQSFAAPEMEESPSIGEETAEEDDSVIKLQQHFPVHEAAKVVVHQPVTVEPSVPWIHLQEPQPERLLPIGVNKPSEIHMHAPKLERGGVQESFDSTPHSKGDPTSSSVDIEESCTSMTSETASPSPEGMVLELPALERLLPVGTAVQIQAVPAEVKQATFSAQRKWQSSQPERNLGIVHAATAAEVQQHLEEPEKLLSTPIWSPEYTPRSKTPVAGHTISEGIRKMSQTSLIFEKMRQDSLKDDGSGTQAAPQQPADEDISTAGARPPRRSPRPTDTHSVGFWPGQWRDWACIFPNAHAPTTIRQSNMRVGEDCVQNRCTECGALLEVYSDEEIGLCIVALGTFVHREPGIAAPLMPEMLRTVILIAAKPTFAWQSECNIYLQGGATSVANQFIRCVLHQLAPNGIFLQLFQQFLDCKIRKEFFSVIAHALSDFNELNSITPLQLLLEGLNSKKCLPTESLSAVVTNIAEYLECLPFETPSPTWGSVLPLFDAFFRKMLLCLPNLKCHANVLLRIMASVLKIPSIATCKNILDPFSKVLSFTCQNRPFKYKLLLEVCHLANRGFTREREKLLLTRTAVFELVQAIKFKTTVPDASVLMLLNFILQDAGGTLAPCTFLDEVSALLESEDNQTIFNTGASECMRAHLGDALEFLADFHTLSKVKSNFKGIGVGLNEDTLGAALKSGIAQYLSLEITRGNSRDNRAVARYLPWLYNPPSAMQQGPREFLDCVSHVRLLSWLLLGCLTHLALLGCSTSAVCQPVPLEASCHVADHIQVILTGFAEQSKASVMHMSSLFHAFILCQLWTVYFEQMIVWNMANVDSSLLTDFWGKVTPGILQLVSHSKVLAEMVNLHFLSLMEALLECNSTILSKLLPVWSPVLFSHTTQLPGHLQVRLQNCLDFPPEALGGGTGSTGNNNDTPSVMGGVLIKWLQRLQFKMGQIELQSSAATQFYSL